LDPIPLNIYEEPFLEPAFIGCGILDYFDR